MQFGSQYIVIVIARWVNNAGTLGFLADQHPVAMNQTQIDLAIASYLSIGVALIVNHNFNLAAGIDHDWPVGKRMRANGHQHYGVQ